MSGNDKFEPMYNIPSMEELDRQWKEMEAMKQNGEKSSANQRVKALSDGADNGKKAGSAQPDKTAKKRGKKGKKKKKFPKLRFALKIFFLLLLLTVLVLLVAFYFKFGDDLIRWKSEAKELVEESNEKTFRSSETSIIYSASKKPIAKLKGDKDSSYVDFGDIPKAAVDCMVVSEDRDFYEHGGVNFLSTAKATMLYVKGKLKGDNSITRGGSTITQQLAKNVFLSNEKTEERKIREIFIAMELEQKYTKDQIMEYYLNVICFANNHWGIEAASKAYFSKSVKDLDLAEIAFLCAIPNRPSTYDPLSHFDNTIQRKDRILEQLLEEGKITAAEYSDAKYEDIILNPAKDLKTQDYSTTFAVACATKALMRKQGFEFQTSFMNDAERKSYDKKYKEAYDECHTMLYTGGYRIYTTLSNSKQKKLQHTINEALAGFKQKNKEGIYKLQGAATCIDNRTGFVVAIVGGRKQKNTTGGYTLNRAFQSFRQPGSSFKPLVVYTPQLERDYTPETIVDDKPFKDGPKNSDGTYLGKIPLRTAVEKSKNVVAWKLFEELTPRVGLSYVEKMHFSEIVDNDYFPAASLGGLTNGASTVEMASAYSTIENDGIFRDPTCVRKITDSEGNMIVNNKNSREEKQIYEETAARMMTDILSGVLVRGTARGHELSNDMACAGKTGTTSDKKDGWFCGFTPYYTTSVWVGYDTPRTLNDLYGNTYPLTIWYNFMEEIHQNLEPKEFNTYDGQKKKKSDDDEDDKYQEEEPTVDPDAVDHVDDSDEEEKPKATKKPKVTKDPDEDDDVEDIPDEPQDDDGEDDIPEDTPEPDVGTEGVSG